MDILSPKYKRDPNAKVDSLYFGVAPGARTVTTLVKPSADGSRMEATRTYGPGLARGVSGRVATLVLGGMETTLDEMEYILESARAKQFTPKRTPQDIAAMCRIVAERRNERIMERRKHPDHPVGQKRKVRLHLPVGVRYVQTKELGLKVLARI